MDLELRLIVERLDLDDESQLGLLYENFDAHASRIAGITFLTVSVPVDEGSRLASSRRLIMVLEKTVSLRVCDLDLDLVDEAEIARRTGWSRQRVNPYVNNRRSHDFPTPSTLVGNRRAWSWASVNTWLSRNFPDDADHMAHLCVVEQRSLAAWIANRPKVYELTEAVGMVMGPSVATYVTDTGALQSLFWTDSERMVRESTSMVTLS